MPVPAFATDHPDGATLSIKVVTGASRARIVGVMADGVLKVAVSKPPSGGQANAAVLELLADALDVPRRSLELVGGLTSPRKTILVKGLDSVLVQQRLE